MQTLTGLLLVSAGITILLINLAPVISMEVQYIYKNTPYRQEQVKPSQSQPSLSFAPIDSQFSVIVPKVEINAKVIPNIDPFNDEEYKAALAQGVAHAKNTSYPDGKGNVFIFAHSTRFTTDVQKYNAIFYLLDKLETEDSIYLVYKEKLYHYKVKDKKIIDPSEIEFLQDESEEKTLTLMTCWPAGTTLKRLLVISQLIDPS